MSMLCDFITIETPAGCTHTCRRCGTIRATRLPRLIRECRGDLAVRSADSFVVLKRLGICHRCTQRPAGCWKAVDYGCQIEYRKAGTRAAERGICPLRKLDFGGRESRS